MNQSIKRGVGRPRANSQLAEISARDDIIRASASLFAEFGFKGTSTRKIAETVGIRQPSLFHHFKKKDDILRALIDQSRNAVITYFEEIDYNGDARVEFYQLMIRDFYFLATEPWHINKIMNLPEVRNGPFKDIIENDRARFLASYKKLIFIGKDQGWFVVPNLEIAANTIFGMGESIWSWHDRKSDIPAIDIAENIADMAIKSLLTRPSSLPSIKKNIQFP